MSNGGKRIDKSGLDNCLILFNRKFCTILHYIEFLKARYTSSEPQPEQPKKRQAGRLKGKIIMAEDFDAPLEDLKDYM
jgi:hypothetical protein